jgi:NitT/TauT family transport system substrate-binding protein
MRHLLACSLALLAIAGCSQQASDKTSGQAATTLSKETPVLSLAWSEYPSWSVFGVAHEKGLLNKAKGEMGSIEKELGVDIVLVQADYEACLSQYANGTVDAVCMTNMDALAPATGRDSVAVLPTSTSAGADACIAVGIDSIEALKGTPTFGLEKSVSQYAFERGLEVAGQKPADFEFKNMDPANAALAMQTGDAAVKSIMVWNPFVLQTLRDRDGSKRLFDSKDIPEEIIDMVVVGKDALAKPGADKCVQAVLKAFYQVNEMLAASETRDATLKALGEKFSSLGVEDMGVVVEETKMYPTADAGIGLFEQDDFQIKTMPAVVDFCLTHDIVSEKPTVGFGDAAAQLNFDASFMKAYAGK